MRKTFRLLLFFVLSFQGLCVFASTVEKSLYIFRGNFLAVDSSSFLNISFDTLPQFVNSSPTLAFQSGDSVNFTIHNQDTIDHFFSIKGINNTVSIPAKDSAIYSVRFSTSGLHIYADTSQQNSYLGLTGLIHVLPKKVSTNFYWNLRDQQKTKNDSIHSGYPVNFTDYYPDYFTINGNSNPYVNQDTTARITGNVGDTIHINIANTGQSVHSLHFHGYHCKLLESSKFPNHKNRIKDTFPIYSMETLILELIPDKQGEYPVHDHNLIGVTGGGHYPNGMFTTILIK